MTLEDCRDLTPVTDNMHGYRLLEDEAQVLRRILTSSLLVSLVPSISIYGWIKKISVTLWFYNIFGVAVMSNGSG